MSPRVKEVFQGVIAVTTVPNTAGERRKIILTLHPFGGLWSWRLLTDTCKLSGCTPCCSHHVPLRKAFTLESFSRIQRHTFWSTLDCLSGTVSTYWWVRAADSAPAQYKHSKSMGRLTINLSTAIWITATIPTKWKINGLVLRIVN